jgi:hypothetical protein
MKKQQTNIKNKTIQNASEMRKLKAKNAIVHSRPFRPSSENQPTARILRPHGLRAQQPTIRLLKWPDAST